MRDVMAMRLAARNAAQMPAGAQPAAAIADGENAEPKEYIRPETIEALVDKALGYLEAFGENTIGDMIPEIEANKQMLIHYVVNEINNA